MPGGHCWRARSASRVGRWLPVVSLLVWSTAVAHTTLAAQREAGDASPGSEIVFASDRGDPSAAVQVLGLGRRPRELARLDFGFFGDLPPHGNWIVAGRVGGGAVDLEQVATGRWRTLTRLSPGSVASSTAYSPDGTRVALGVHRVGGHDGLDIVSVRTGRRRVFWNGCGDSDLTWSPDSRHILCTDSLDARVFDVASGRVRFIANSDAAMWSSTGLLAIGYSTSRASWTRVVDAGGHVRARLPGKPLCWSPDGSLLVVGRTSSFVIFDLARHRAHTIRMSLDPDPRAVGFSPDGRFIAFGNHIEPVGGGRPRALPGDPQQLGVWSPNGRHFAFVKQPQDASALEVLIGDRFGLHARLVGRIPNDFEDENQGGGGGYELAWMPDSSHLLCGRFGEVMPDELWGVHLNGSGLHRFSTGADELRWPSWSPDGTRLAYGTSLVDSSGTLQVDSVEVADARGHRLRRISLRRWSKDGWAPEPTWSPDGNTLAVGFAGDDPILGVDLETGLIRTLTPNNGSSPSFSPDGTRIAYVNEGAIWMETLATSMAAEFFGPSALGRVNSLAWSPDGNLLAFTTIEGLFVMAADGSGAPRSLYGGRANRPSFDQSGERIVFAAPDPYAAHEHDLFVTDVKGDKLQLIGRSFGRMGEPAVRP
jgi:Tol biopolymer transport system component